MGTGETPDVTSSDVNTPEEAAALTLLPAQLGNFVDRKS
jgi:hypothetical protein